VPTELFQIWIEPARRGVQPAWAARRFPAAEKAGRLLPLASGRIEAPEVLRIHQDATLFGAHVEAGGGLEVPIEAGRLVYLVPAEGDIVINGVVVPHRAGAMISGETALTIAGRDGQSFDLVLADLPEHG
jgi:hypothetical protein